MQQVLKVIKLLALSTFVIIVPSILISYNNCSYIFYTPKLLKAFIKINHKTGQLLTQA